VSLNADAFAEIGQSDENTDAPDPQANLPSSCTVLTCSDPQDFGREQTFYLVGTAHVSTESCEDVKKVIQLVKPEVTLWKSS